MDHGNSAEDRSWSGGYRYGFNGMEKDNEVKGLGNSYDFDARMFDPRLGRWLSIDPLAAKYPFVSSYVFVLNNPIIFIDPDGREVEWADKESKKAYKELKSAYKKAGSLRYNDLIRIEKAKDVVFKINVNSDADLGNNDATARYNSSNSTNDKIQIDILIRKDVDTREGYEKKDKRVVMADELEHGRQFLDGDLGFKIDDGESYAIGYDQQDEIKSQEASVDASKALNVPLNKLQENFESRKIDQNFIDNHYSQLSKSKDTQSGNAGKTDGELKKYFNLSEAKITEFVYRKDDKNVVLKKDNK